MKKTISLTLVFSLFYIISFGTTWVPVEHSCPICKTKSTYQEIASYGGYIYSWPSKFQYVYWPYTDSQSIYCCVECYFSTFMWDFDSVPTDKIEEIKTTLSISKLDKKYANYLDIAASLKLEIAEKVYKILGKDPQFWSLFYRVSAYHYELGSTEDEDHFGQTKKQARDADAEKAKEMRLKVLKINSQQLTDSSFLGKEKELYYIAAAMHNSIGNRDSAAFYLSKSRASVFFDKKLEDDRNKGFNDYLNGVIEEYFAILNKKE